MSILILYKDAANMEIECNVTNTRRIFKTSSWKTRKQHDNLPSLSFKQNTTVTAAH